MKKLYCLLLASVLIWALPANVYNGATASVRGKLSKTLHIPVVVNISLTCSPNGIVS